MKPDRKRPSVMLGLLRLTGAGAFLAPQLATRVLALDASPQSRYLVRLFAARNAVMVAGLWTSAGSARRRWWQAGIACDALDVAAALLAVRDGKPRSSALLDAGAALVAGALGVEGLLGEGGEAR
jgi:hypothetical protein